MKKVIWKFSIDAMKINKVREKIMDWLYVGFDPKGKLCVWGIVDPDAAEEQKKDYLIELVGTGHDFSEEFYHAAEFIGTVNDGPFMWHVFALEVE